MQLSNFARVLIFPYGIWLLCARIARSSWVPKKLRVLAGLGLFVAVGLPISLFIATEILVGLNRLAETDDTDYTPVSDFDSHVAEFKLPGAPAPQSRDQDLVDRFSPVIIQKLGAHPLWDIPVTLDFDGNQNPRDNVIHASKLTELVAGVHGELTAETDDSYFFTYSIYHIRDYDYPLRQLICSWSQHDNDNEGVHIRVDKKSLEPVEMETWFHNRFLLFNRTGKSSGTEPVYGRLNLENGSHSLIYVQGWGHGIRGAQAVDLQALNERVKVFRSAPKTGLRPTPANLNVELNAPYDIESMDPWYEQAINSPQDGIFTGKFEVGREENGTPIELASFFASSEKDVMYWARPKPPWAWVDPWDEIAVSVWHFYPSRAFSSHSGIPLSHHYLSNRPIEKIFKRDPNLFYARIHPKTGRFTDNKWKTLEPDGPVTFREIWRPAFILIKNYFTYLTRQLG